VQLVSRPVVWRRCWAGHRSQHRDRERLLFPLFRPGLLAPLQAFLRAQLARAVKDWGTALTSMKQLYGIEYVLFQLMGSSVLVYAAFCIHPPPSR